VVVGLALSQYPDRYVSGSAPIVGSHMPDRSKVMIQTKIDTLVLLVGGWDRVHNTTP
jgi:hypothetical protein